MLIMLISVSNIGKMVKNSVDKLLIIHVDNIFLKFILPKMKKMGYNVCG